MMVVWTSSSTLLTVSVVHYLNVSLIPKTHPPGSLLNNTEKILKLVTEWCKWHQLNDIPEGKPIHKTPENN